MIQFTKPTNLNGTELRAELRSSGVEISDAPNAVAVDGNDNLLLDILEKDKSKASEIVAAHNGTTVGAEPTVAEKLASVGLSVDDLKAALGLA
jgi:hypothetical protein